MLVFVYIGYFSKKIHLNTFKDFKYIINWQVVDFWRASGEGPSGPGFIGIYADDTHPDSVAVYICQGASADEMTLAQAFKVRDDLAVKNYDQPIVSIEGEVITFREFIHRFDYDHLFELMDYLKQQGPPEDTYILAYWF